MRVEKINGPKEWASARAAAKIKLRKLNAKRTRDITRIAKEILHLIQYEPQHELYLDELFFKVKVLKNKE